MQERRRTPRAALAGIHVTCQDASGNRLDGRALNIGRGGLFFERSASQGPRATRPTPLAIFVGKRVTLEIEVQSQPGPWAGLGRVIWSRESPESDESAESRPPGLGIRIVDLDESAGAVIDRLVDASRTVKGPSSAVAPLLPVPSREKTVLGIGSEATVVSEPTPIVAVGPARERTALGVGSGETAAAMTATAPATSTVGAAETSMAIDLIAAKQPPAARLRSEPPAPQREPSIAPLVESETSEPGLRRARRAWSWWVLALVLLVIAGTALALTPPTARVRVHRAITALRTYIASKCLPGP